MNSQVVVNIDTELKNKAMSMAKKQWLTMKALMSFLLKWYTDNSITLWARLERDYSSDLEIIPWTEEELSILNQDQELKDLWDRFNKLIIDKWI